MLAFHPVTSSCCLLRAKWSIRQAACTIRCSLKTRFPRINNLNLYYENESNVISAGFSHVQSSELTLASSLRINEDQRMRSSGFHCFIIVKTSRLLCFYNRPNFLFRVLAETSTMPFFFLMQGAEFDQIIVAHKGNKMSQTNTSGKKIKTPNTATTNLMLEYSSAFVFVTFWKETFDLCALDGEHIWGRRSSIKHLFLLHSPKALNPAEHHSSRQSCGLTQLQGWDILQSANYASSSSKRKCYAFPMIWFLNCMQQLWWFRFPQWCCLYCCPQTNLNLMMHRTINQ